MSILIRDAQAADASAIAELLTQLGYPSSSKDTVDRLKEWRESALSRVVVATVNQRVIGVLAFHAIPFLEQTGRRGRVVCLVVDEASRGQGAGAHLIQEAEAEAHRLGCKDIELTSARTRTAAHAFYEHMGYQDCCDRSARFLRPLRIAPSD